MNGKVIADLNKGAKIQFKKLNGHLKKCIKKTAKTLKSVVLGCFSEVLGSGNPPLEATKTLKKKPAIPETAKLR